MADLNDMTDWSRLQEMLAKKNTGSTTRIDEAGLLAHLRSRVKGQDPILQDVAKLIRLQAAKQQKDKPIANLIFLGPTGTGKTELAKAIAEYLFKDVKAMIRFDCSELNGPESKTRLIGSPTGYIFILTSNAHAEEIGQIQREVTDCHEMINAVKGYLAESKVFRPEILGRIDKVYVFQPLQGMVVAEIALLKISKLAKEYGPGIQFVAPELIMQALIANDKVSRFGIRELERILFDMFATELIDAKDSGATRVQLAVGENGEVVVRPA